MLFIFKKKTIVLDCITSNLGIFNYYPIVKSSTNLPTWWKNLPESFVCGRTPEFDKLDRHSSTMKKCSGFIDLHKNSIVIPSNCDVKIQTTESGIFGYQFSDSSGMENFSIDSHSREEFGSELDHLIHLKIISPWLLFEKTGINFHVCMPFWHHIKTLDKVFIPPGIVNYKYQHTSHINMFVPRADDLIEFTAGTPLLHLIPLTERKVEVKNHIVDDAEFLKLHKHAGLRSRFLNSYMLQKKILKASNKCPFNFKN
jgi:hypothetical protein